MSKTCLISWIDSVGVEHRTTTPMPVDQLRSVVVSLVRDQGVDPSTIGVWADAPLHFFYNNEGDVSSVVLGGDELF